MVNGICIDSILIQYSSNIHPIIELIESFWREALSSGTSWNFMILVSQIAGRFHLRAVICENRPNFADLRFITLFSRSLHLSHVQVTKCKSLSSSFPFFVPSDIETLPWRGGKKNLLNENGRNGKRNVDVKDNFMQWSISWINQSIISQAFTL